MKHHLALCALYSLSLLAVSSVALADELVWTTIAKPWSRELGSHRIIIETTGEAVQTVRVHLPWRRRDPAPEKKAVIVQNASTGKTLPRVEVLRCDAEAGDLVFESLPGCRSYAVYFLPVKIVGGAFPKGQYEAAENASTQAWKPTASIVDEAWRNLPEAKIVAWEALTAHDAWNEMEVIATAEETHELSRQAGGKPFVARLETSDHAVRMFDHLPQRWVKAPISPELTAAPNEHLAFQVVVWPPQIDVKDVKLKFLSLQGAAGSIPAERLSCIATQPTQQGTARVIDVAANRVQPLWCEADVPQDQPAGLYSGTVKVTAASGGESVLPITLRIAGTTLADHGDDTPEKLSRLRWLNSALGKDEDVTLGYEPLRVDGQTIHCLGRSMTLGEGGLPAQIVSHFNSSVTKNDPALKLELLSAPMRFVCTAPDAQPIALNPRSFVFTHHSKGAVEWTAGWDGERIALELHGRMEFDGSLTYRVTVTGSREVGDIRLETPRTAASTRYSTGLGQQGGDAPSSLDWKWDVANKHQDSLWLGAVNGGLRLQFQAENYARAAVNIHYTRRPLNEPASWSNAGNGGIRYADHTLTAFSGARKLDANVPLHFDFNMLITPFHPLRLKEQFTQRYFHTHSVPADIGPYLDQTAKAGANIINIHQGNALNPFINYPFLTADKLAAFTKAAHERNQRVKFYYTIRELSNWTPELFALRSLGDEVLLSGKGGGHPWLEEHLGGDYWGAWYEPGVQDASLLTATSSRLDNYYIEGLRWLVQKAGCDGLYLDDISFDRSVMLRARKVLDLYCPNGGLIDLHSWNELNKAAGYANCINVFMDSLPFVDRLWFGEGHHYAGPPPEHMLVEISGIPFGLMGEMLQGGGNVWLGLTFGMTGRQGWGGNPRDVWDLWDRFGAADADFIGWWSDDCPVTSSAAQVKASVWKKDGKALLAVANFGQNPAPCALKVDWEKLGLDPAKVAWYAPRLGSTQREAIYPADHLPSLAPHAGIVFILSEHQPDLAAITMNNHSEPTDAVLWQDSFQDASSQAWKFISSKHAGNKAIQPNDGLVIIAPANVHAFAERALPANAAAVRANVWQDTDDAGQQWGPGLALMWADGSTLKFSRRQDGRFTVAANGREQLFGNIVQAAPVDLTISWDEQEIRLSVGGEGMGGVDAELARLPRSEFKAKGSPTLLRLGKMPNDAAPRDHSSPGRKGYNRVGNVTVFAPGKS